MRLQSSCKSIIVSNHSVVAAVQTVLTSPHLKSITENTGAVPWSRHIYSAYNALQSSQMFCAHACVKMHVACQHTSTGCAL